VSGGLRFVTESVLSSREVTAPYRVLSLDKLAPVLLRRSPHAFRPRGVGSRVYTLQAPDESLKILGILSWASAPLQRRPKHRAAALNLRFSRDPTFGFAKRQLAAPPLRFSPLQRFPHSEQRHQLIGPAFPNRLRLQVFSTS